MVIRISHLCVLAATITSLILVEAVAKAEIIASSNFASFTNGNLVGQNGWQQLGTVATVPIQVSGGAVTWVRPAAPANDQDAILPFAALIPEPLAGTTVLTYDISLSVATAGTAPSFFAGLNTLNTTATASNFANARLVVQSSGAGFVFGSRVTGQAGFPFAFGTDVFNFNQTYALRAEVNMVAGAQNDFVRILAGNDFNNLTLQTTAVFTTGVGTDPTSYGAIVLSQFDSGTAFQAGVTINSVSVTAVPEPTSTALIGCAVLSAAFIRYRRRCTQA